MWASSERKKQNTKGKLKMLVLIALSAVISTAALGSAKLANA